MCGISGFFSSPERMIGKQYDDVQGLSPSKDQLVDSMIKIVGKDNEMINKQKSELLAKVNKNNIWDEEPVFCFSSDIDWASEDVLDCFFDIIPFEETKLTTFVTHESKKISDLASRKKIYRGNSSKLFGKQLPR